MLHETNKPMSQLSKVVLRLLNILLSNFVLEKAKDNLHFKEKLTRSNECFNGVDYL